MREESLARAMWEMCHKVLLAVAIEALHGAGIVSAVLKGTALAHGSHASPVQRFRGDTHLLVAPGSLAETRTTLSGLGWRRPGPEPGLFGAMH